MRKRYSEPESLGNVIIYMNENSENTQLFFLKNLTPICYVCSVFQYHYWDHFNNINQL